ncbi:nucleoside hydrolase [Sphingomonas sp. S-NIH.Pt3_0716]|nr:nucleoside hydrolase [Sphingomonas sp. S-NIH.Pt3_0716]
MQNRLIIDRRTWLAGLVGLAGQASLTGPAHALTARVRSRVIIDNDFSGDPDGLFQLAHHLLSPSVQIPLVIGSHIHPRDFLDGSDRQADNAVQCVSDLMDCMRLPHRPPVLAGRNAAPAPGTPPSATPAVTAIIAEAQRTDSKLPLFYVAGAGLTDLAEAVRLRPEIARRIILVWIGGPEHGLEQGNIDPTVHVRASKEYNLTIDLAAAQTLFNDSAVEIWQVPRNVYRTLMISHAELDRELAGAGRLGRYLLDQLERAIRRIDAPLGETYILGDSPLVTLTALQSSFDPDAASSDYLIRPTPRINDQAGYVAHPAGRPMRVFTRIDSRLTFADMFAKIRAGSV